MSIRKTSDIHLEIEMHQEYLPVLISLVESGSRVFGLQHGECSQLVLAAEEIFSYLCGLPLKKDRVKARLLDGFYYISLELIIPEVDIPWEAFNLSARPGLDEDSDLKEIGLLLAARFLDGLTVEKHAESGIILNLIKDKSYPAAQPGDFPVDEVKAPCQIVNASPEGLKSLCGLILNHYEEAAIPAFARVPGRLVDMIRSQEYQAALALDIQENVAGGMVWHNISSQLVEFFGPFVSSGETELPGLLVEHCLAKIARTPATALFTRSASPDLPGAYFEPLGSEDIHDTGGNIQTNQPCFRMLHEDNGSSLWIHPVLKGFVAEKCLQMDLPRHLHLALNRGESQEFKTAFLSRLDRQGRQAIIKPLQTGGDAAVILSEYIKVLWENGFERIQIELDLGEALHSELGPAILHCGFTPAYLLPHGGIGDVLVFNYDRPYPAP